jgi:hypothetical protein
MIVGVVDVHRITSVHRVSSSAGSNSRDINEIIDVLTRVRAVSKPR